MQRETRHIIHRLNVEVEVPDLAIARRIHDHALEFINTDVLPRLEALLSSMDGDDIILRSDAVNLDIQLDSEEEFFQALPEKLNASIQEQLAGVHMLQANQSVKQHFKEDAGKEEENFPLQKKLASQEKQWQVWLFFLRTGMLPWFASSGEPWLEEKTILQLMEEQAGEQVEQLFYLLRSHPAARQRLLQQANISFAARMVSKMVEMDMGPFLEILARHERVGSFELRKRQQAFLGRVMEAGNETLAPERLDKWVQELIIPKKTTTEPLEKKQPVVIDENEEALYVAHAGLVLLHPFLQFYFRALHLMEGDQFNSREDQETAVHLLHYLATGEEQAAEYDMAMEKYLCGMYLHEPIERFIEISGTMKEESDQLLKAVIHHWKALKNTSADGLREAFLQRNGKLVFGWQHRLVVEHHAVDVLLDQLPWNHSIITLPWMSKVLYVDWLTGL